MTPLTVLVASAHRASRPYGRYAFVSPPTHIDLLGDAANLRDSAPQRARSRCERQILYDPCACAAPMPLI